MTLRDHSLLPQRGTKRWAFWFRRVVLLVLLSVLIPSSPVSSLIGTSRAFASGSYVCDSNVPGGANCHGLYDWFGATWGAQTQVYLRPYTCSPCNTTNHYHINSTLWVVDFHDQAFYGAIEVGYGAIDRVNGELWYYWANSQVGQTQQVVPIAAVPQDHWNQYTGFKLTRNTQAADKVVVQIMSYNNPKYWGTVATNSMGSSTFLGTHQQIGMEVQGSGAYTSQSSQGNRTHMYNQWQSNDGVYHYQGYGDDTNLVQEGPMSAWWQSYPQNTTFGGLLVTSCGCQ